MKLFIPPKAKGLPGTFHIDDPQRIAVNEEDGPIHKKPQLERDLEPDCTRNKAEGSTPGVVGFLLVQILK